MKPSHLRTPRTLSECYFVEGYYTVEPSMWQGRWNAASKQTIDQPNSFPWKAVGFGAVALAVIAAILIQPLL